MGIVNVMIQHTNGDALDGLSGLGIIHNAVHTITGLLHECQHAIVIVAPKIGQLRGIGGLGSGTLHSHLAALGISVHIILTTTSDGIPGGASSYAIIIIITGGLVITTHIGRIKLSR